MKLLSLVCPAYNEESVIEAFYIELARCLKSLSDRYEFEIIFVVDKSQDRTLDILRGVAASDHRVKILALSTRFGHQMSLVAGIDHCRGDAVVMMDTDLQQPPSLIPTLIAEYERGYDIVHTIRTKTANVGFFRSAASSLFYKGINKISEVRIEENAADFRLISKKVVKVFQTQIRERNQFLRGLLGWVGFKSTTVKYEASERHSGRSKYNFSKLLRFAANGVVSFSKKPLQAAIYFGTIFACLGFLLAAYTAVDYYTGGSYPPGWATLAVVTSVFSGIQLIFMGIFGEYIGAIFDEVKGRPRYIIEENIGFDEERQRS